MSQVRFTVSTSRLAEWEEVFPPAGDFFETFAESVKMSTVGADAIPLIVLSRF